MPLGVLSSAVGGGSAGSAFELIETQTISSGGTYVVTFSSIPSTYKHLQLRVVAQSNYGSYADNLRIKLNGVSFGSYAKHRLYSVGNGAVFSAGGGSETITPYMPGSADGSNIFGFMVADILDYTNTNKYKTWRSMSGYTGNNSRWQELTSGLLMSTSAITTIAVDISSGYYFQPNSRLSLYGIKGE